MEKIKIEKGQSLVNTYREGSTSRLIYDAMKEMDIGDSFVVKHSFYSTFNAIRRDTYFYNMYFVSEKISREEIRIFRLK